MPKGVAVLGGIEALRQFKIFADLEEEDFEAIGKISHVREFETAEKLTTEGAPADNLYLFLKGKAAVKVRGADGRQIQIDELGPGEMLGWAAVVEPHLYTASAWTTRRSEVIVVDGRHLRELCEQNKRVGYEVAKGIGEVISKRFGLAVGARGGPAIGKYGVDQLRQFKIFSELDVSDLDSIAQIALVQEFDTGEELTVEGAPAEQLFLFLKGRATVTVAGPDGAEVVIDELGPGELLGWGAVMEPHVYTASARTTEPCELFVVDGRELRELCETNKRIGYQVAKGIGEVMSRRFGHAVSGRAEEAVTGLGPADLRRFKIFAELDETELKSIAEISHVQEYETGEELTAEGAPADNLYLFVKGRAAVKVRSSEGRQVLIDELGPGEMLGWGAFMAPHVYTASAWTTEPSELVVVDGQRLRELGEANKHLGFQVARGVGEVISKRFGRVLAGKGEQALGGYAIDELHQFKIFSELDVAELEAIAGISHVQDFEAGQQLIAEGAAAHHLYLFLKGKAAVEVQLPEGDQILIDELGPGEMLGWAAFMPPHLYTASAWATEPSQLIVVDGERLRQLCDVNKHMGYQVAKGVGEVMSKRFGHAVGGHGITELHQFKIFAGLDVADLDAIGRISHIRDFDAGEELITEGGAADKLYLVLRGKVEVKVRSPEGRQILIDELGPGEMLGWGAVMEPHVHSASAWTAEPSELVVVNGDSLRELCEQNKRLGYQVVRGIGEVISKRFGRAFGERAELHEKDLRAFGGGERVIWDSGELQLTTRAVLIGMEGGSPEVLPLEAVYDVEVQGDSVVFHAHGGDVSSPPVDDPERLAALAADEMRRTRYARRRKDYYLGSG
ncbi:MAG: cyclic nucleotide-binding domain-containing protein [Actinomycetia bacterium]|nr:cyclic nucleotide-binding domain-containing protein [Actinomycetes bacterium]